MDPQPSLTPEQWRRLEVLFDAAQRRPEAQRRDFAQEACADDTALCHLLLKMLDHEEAGNTFEQPAWQASDEPSTQRSVVDRTGQLCGNYRLVRLLGQGGMGAVWLAERTDQEFEQQVAVKLLSTTGLQDEAVRRFRNERQLLAELRHPHIASLLDGGTTADQQPYLVMEYIDGVRIDEYSRSHHLEVRQRIELFLDVCRAVEHAHGRLVVHRDIKPGNILVSAEGQVKLLDFGIAKVLEASEPDAASTQTQYRCWTPLYSSPEQITGAPLTTASDVYALGVVLYELLTLRSPYRADTTSVPELIRAVCEGDIVPPSKVAFHDQGELDVRRARAWRHALAGDLDAVILRCLARDAAHRYPSVERLRADLTAYLEGREVSARRPGVLDRLGKRIRRHRIASAALAIGAVGLAAGLAIGLHQYLQARRAWHEEAGQRQLAETRLSDLQDLHGALAREKDEVEVQRALAEGRARDIRELAHTAVFDIANQAAAHAPTQALQRIVGTGLDALERLREQAGDDPEYLGELAVTYTKMGLLWSGYGSQSLGNLVEADKTLQTAVVLAQQAYDLDPSRPGGSYVLSRTLLRLGELRHQQGRYLEAVEILQRSLELCRAIADPGSKMGYRALLYHCLCAEGVSLLEVGRVEEARESLAESEQGRRGLVREFPRYIDFLPNLADVIHQRVLLDRSRGDTAAALSGAQEAREYLQRSLELYPGDHRILRSDVVLHLTLAELQRLDGDPEDAEQTLEAAAETLAGLRTIDPDSQTLAADEVNLHGQRAKLLALQGEALDAEAEFALALAKVRSLGERVPGNDRVNLMQAQLLIDRAEFFRQEGFFAEAHDDLDRSRELLTRTPESRNRLGLRVEHASVLGRLWRLQAQEERDPTRREDAVEAAREAFREAVEGARRLGNADHQAVLEGEVQTMEERSGAARERGSEQTGGDLAADRS